MRVRESLHGIGRTGNEGIRKREAERGSCSDFLITAYRYDAYHSEFAPILPRNITSPLSVCTVQKERRKEGGGERKTKTEVALRGDPSVA